MKKEPRRCLNCQSLEAPHLAATCRKPMVCGTCSKDHRTTKCTENDQERHWCVNCKTFSHTSWDQSCPKFTEEIKRLEHLNPESMYIYFPTDKPWTWEQLRNSTTSEMGNHDPDLRDTQYMEPTAQARNPNKYRTDRGTSLRRQGSHPQTDTETLTHTPFAPLPSQEPNNRVHQHENLDSDWQYHLGRQRIMDKFAPSLSD